MLQFEELRRKTIETKKENLMEEKEYQRNLQHLQTQLEIAREHRKSMDPTSVKKKLEDYE